jgi:hypothetical protein
MIVIENVYKKAFDFTYQKMKTNGTDLKEIILLNTRRHKSLLPVLIIGAIFWIVVFNAAAYDFVIDGNRPFRGVWNGWGVFSLWGFNFTVEFEGWADHDYFYHSWAEQFLKGYLPYTDSFNVQIINDTLYRIPYFFPPLYLYLCVLGKLIHVDLGIGFLICLFGYLTVLPVYGIAEYLSKNKDVATIAAASYLLNPLILYHTVFEWLNPAPFVFFAMLSFYLLMKGHRTSGLLAMVTSALFKQTAFFFILPLIAYFVKRPPGAAYDEVESDTDEGSEREASETDSEKKETRPLSDKVDLQSFGKVILVAVLYAFVLSLPYIIYNFQNYFYYVFQRMGATLLDRVDELPPGNWPITFAVVFIYLGAPEWLSNAVNYGTYYNILLLIGILPLFAFMLLEVKDDEDLQGYWRKILWLTMLVILWVHVFSPRGIYKYYFVLLIPFFCIFSSAQMIYTKEEFVPLSHYMIWVPAVLTFLILVPSRYVYPLFVFIITIAYASIYPIKRRLKIGLEIQLDEESHQMTDPHDHILTQQ